MTNLNILYLSAAVLAFSDLLALVTIAIWTLGKRSPRHARQFRVVGFTRASDEALGFEVS